jgi:hypothetical protein
MTQDWFEQLAEQEVPPMPVDFDLGLHEKVNDSLLGVHYLELVCRVAPYALLHFAIAMLAAFCFSLSGEYPNDRSDRTSAPR